ncbi:putative orfan [Tupanvirus soda lake]|uniref:Orfan n=2 Tax=Tupanvirus TaxID=2094720 RepID=A0AC62AB21_9VIRU|nr:putative orfan [Tupanvirus soda lake]QKU34946.1 putative orfan [Tupanvirus soda lake]
MGNIFIKKKKNKTKQPTLNQLNKFNEATQEEINDAYDYYLYKKYQIERPNSYNYSLGYNTSYIYY